MKRLFVFALACVLAACAFATAAAAAYVPDNEICENRDGRQLIIRTYTLAPGDDPSGLAEGSFDREGYTYSCVSIVKEEVPFERREQHTETVTVETQKNDLATILGELDATILLDCGEYSVVLALDHTSLHTEATGHSTRSYTVTDTKTIEGLDRNDPSYVPKTTVKNGVTLNLQNIEWAVQSTALADDALVPAQYMAIATYSANASYSAANGYITTATYTGEATYRGIESVVYTATYLGEPIPLPEPEPEPETEPVQEPEPVADEAPQEPEPEQKNTRAIKYLGGICAVIVAIAAVMTAAACFGIYRNMANNIRREGYVDNTFGPPAIEEDIE